jgi:hypothetical protein
LVVDDRQGSAGDDYQQEGYRDAHGGATPRQLQAHYPSTLSRLV